MKMSGYKASCGPFRCCALNFWYMPTREPTYTHVLQCIPASMGFAQPRCNYLKSTLQFVVCTCLGTSDVEYMLCAIIGSVLLSMQVAQDH